jgi:pyruvate/2-oxoglutarate/acetoin dehydrogenase E1 component
MKEGADITLVSYGSTLIELLRNFRRYYCEIIDVQSLLPFDINLVKESIAKTSRLLVIDEDVPGLLHIFYKLSSRMVITT